MFWHGLDGGKHLVKRRAAAAGLGKHRFRDCGARVMCARAPHVLLLVRTHALAFSLLGRALLARHRLVKLVAVLIFKVAVGGGLGLDF